MTLFGAIALGLLIGLSLGALGGGGSILTVPALVYVLHEPAQAATTGSLVIVGVTSLVGSIGHARSGNVRWGFGLAFGVAGIAASYAGTAVNRAVNPNVLLLAFGALMIVAAVGMIARTRKPTPSPVPVPVGVGAGGTSDTVPADDVDPSSEHGPNHHGYTTGTIIKIIITGLVVGFLTGFLGVGGGFIIVPALVMVLGFPMPIAVGTSLLIIAINSAAALAARAGHATFDWHVIIPFTLAAIVGSLIGKRIADKASGPALARAFAGLMIAVAIYTIAESAISLSSS